MQSIRTYKSSEYYELTDHLGNVRAVFSDRKIAEDTDSDGDIDSYALDVKSWSDYYAFGMPMPSRTYNSQEYRFGFNGMEKDPEITGQEGSHYTAAFWEYDSRIGRRWNVDPVVKFHESSYAALANNPIIFIDPFGNDTTSSLDGYNKQVEEFNDEFHKNLLDAMDNPLKFLNESSESILNLLCDVTFISNLTGRENKTAKSLGEMLKGAGDIIEAFPEMTNEEKGALTGAAVFILTRELIDGLLPGKFSSKSHALTQLKKDAKIPKNQKSLDISYKKLKENGKTVVDEGGKPILTRVYTHETTNGQRVLVQEHSVGHQKGNVTRHFNVRPEDNPKGKVEGTLEHYTW